MAPAAALPCPADPYVPPHWLYCAWCHLWRRVAEDGARWESCTAAQEAADRLHSSHGVCPDCYRRLRAEAVHLTPITWEREQA